MIFSKSNLSAITAIAIATLFITTSVSAAAEKTVYLDTLETGNIVQGWNEPGINKSVEGNELSIGGKVFARGIGTHAESICVVDLKGTATGFAAKVGIDDEMAKGRGSVQFQVIADDKLLWQSNVMRAGDGPTEVNLTNLTGVKYLQLKVTDRGNGVGQDHADWAEAIITYTGDKPQIIGVTALPRPISPTNRSEARAALIPYPRKVEWSDENFNIAKYKVTMPADDAEELSFICDKVHDLMQKAGGEISNEYFAKKISLKYGTVPGSDNKEAYALKVTKSNITITAAETAGLFYGMQTLRQLIQTDKGRTFIPCCEITDQPAFKYRGLMHDVGRNFQTIDFLKEQMDILAQYKYNVFHMHLTDYPAWRMEIKAYPQLTAAENHRQTRQPGKFYTQDEIRDFVSYCKKRHILVIPEIDMPGHSTAFKTAMGVDMQSEKGIEYLKVILDEVCEVFKDTLYIHIGSDEVHIKIPEFLPTMAASVRKHGKEIIVWRPGGMPDDKVVTQLWARGTAITNTAGYIDSRANYINHLDPFAGIYRLFNQQPCDLPTGNDKALGGIICHWPDVNTGTQENNLRTSPFWPAVLTYSERIWRGARNNRLDLWAKMAQPYTEAYVEFKEFESDLRSHRDLYFADKPFPYIRQTNIPWKILEPIDHKGKLDASFEPEKTIKPSYTIDGKTYAWNEEFSFGGTIHLRHFFGFPSHIRDPKESTAYALTYIYSETEQDAHMWIGFNGGSRSGRDAQGNPPVGKWSFAESNIYLNDKAIQPPTVTNPDVAQRAGHEIPFADEDYFYRTPTSVHFKKGWNKVLVKAPYGKWKNSKPRKWMFTAVPVKWDGRRVTELESVRFANEKEFNRLMGLNL